MNENNHASTGIGFGTALTLIFVVLKLTNLIQWDWIWILSPLWITLLIWVGIFAIIIIALTIGLMIKSIKIAKKNKKENNND